MRHAAWVCVLAVACAEEPTGDADDDGDAATDEDTETLGDSGTDTETTPPQWDCFADWSIDLGDDGDVEGTGIDAYDAVRTDLILYSYRFFSITGVYSYSYTYDEDGNLVRYEYDDGDDGVADYVATYTWDPEGNLVRYERDSDGDGDLDYVATYAWDENGNIEAYTIDEDGDGELDHSYSYTYDDAGLRLHAEEDLDGDGLSDIWFTYTYDAVGRRATTTADAGNDGTVDALLTFAYTDPVLRVGTSVLESTIEEYPPESNVFEHDAEDRLLFLETDDGSDQFVDYRFSAVYDPVTGVLVEEDEETFEPPPNDSNVDWSYHHYTYDGQLRLIEEFEDGLYVQPDIEFGRLSREQWVFGGSCP